MSINRKEVLINLCRKVCYFLRDTVEFSRKKTFCVYLTLSNSRKKHVSCLQIYLKRKTICNRSNRVIFDLCCNNYGLFFAPTRTMGGFIQLFAALREPLLLLASHPARKLLENRVPKTCLCMYSVVSVFACV